MSYFYYLYLSTECIKTIFSANKGIVRQRAYLYGYRYGYKTEYLIHSILNYCL